MFSSDFNIIKFSLQSLVSSYRTIAFLLGCMWFSDYVSRCRDDADDVHEIARQKARHIVNILRQIEIVKVYCVYYYIFVLINVKVIVSLIGLCIDIVIICA